MNVSNLTYDPLENALYNPSCIAEMEKFQSFCTDFKANVIQTVGDRFLLVIIVNAIIVFFKFYIKYGKPQFAQTEFYKKKIEYRIDFIQMIVVLISIAYLFL